METTIQITVAGVLLLAWIWVLGRPLVSTQGRVRHGTGSVPYRDHVLAPADLSPEGSDLLDFEPSSGRRILEAAKSWLRRPREVWRRQLLLATMFATFGSFLLATALRGVFVPLFGLMLIVLVFHLVLAVFIGGRMLAANRARAVAVAKRSVSAPGMSIRAERVGGAAPVDQPVRVTLEGESASFETGPDDSTEADAEADPVEAVEIDGIDSIDSIDSIAGGPVDGGPVEEGAIEGDADDGIEVGPVEESLDDGAVDGAVEDEPADSAFDLAAEMASGLGEGGPSPLDEAAVVSDLIESEWGDDDEVERVPAHDEVVTADDDPDQAADAIFRRAAKDEPARQRRSAKAIHIESQLDDGGDFPGAKAVNHP